ncbi:hypothetical protein [Streptosporangium lutulentum]|uniref:Uncharacterized protein n=1 Tax=Streptosporangium lutulentum TaxID=1461250 RepID=A0ABT9QU32_9ACTN|nr:hypothetical protein [Streptosporangium lutulentum]MDP9850283.1 hypothetical protein [Streptosporangium lutulentum]
MPTVESSPEWTDIVTALFALLALLVAIWAAWKASQQADMAADSARFAGTQAEAAKEQVNIALRQLELSEKVRREQQEPYVVVDIQPNSSINKAFDLIIENVGPTVARNVKIAFDPPLERFEEREEGGLERIAESFIFTEGIPFMPPGRRINLFLDFGYKRLNSDLPTGYIVTVNAEGPYGAVEPLIYKIDLGIYTGYVGSLTVKNIHDGVKALERIADKVSLIEGKISRSAKRAFPPEEFLGPIE